VFNEWKKVFVEEAYKEKRIEFSSVSNRKKEIENPEEISLMHNKGERGMR